MNVDPDDLVYDTVIGDEWRWTIVVVGVLCALTIVALWVSRRRQQRVGFAESMSLLGGAAVCASVSWASLGLIFNWDSAWRVPVLLAALVYVLIGRGLELWRTKKRK